MAEKSIFQQTNDNRPIVVVLRGARDICAAVGENPKEIVSLVEQHDLPAWRREGRGAWRALPEDLYEWARKQKYLYCGKHDRAVYGVAAKNTKKRS